MNIKVISRNVGMALLVSSLFMFISVLVSLGNGHDSALFALIVSFLITFTAGIFPFIFVKKSSNISIVDGYMITFLSWMLSFIFGMLPYLLYGGPFTVVNAWFESVSGFTTTGASILDDVEALPDSLLFWRASTHFIGGLGVVVFLLIIIPTSAPIRLRLSNMQISSLSKDGYLTGTNKTVYMFSAVYLTMNLVTFILYWIAGMRPLDAICHTFSVCASGGFSSRNMSIASFNSMPITLISMVVMFLSSIHFGIIYLTVVTRSFKPLNNPVLKFYVSFLAIASLIITVALKAKGVEDSWGESLLAGSFHVISCMSSTGFALEDTRTWPYLCTIILLACGLCCGMAGSTTGGVKADRILILLKTIRVSVFKSVAPSSVAEVKIGGRVLKPDDVTPHILYIGLFSMFAIISTVICLLVKVDNKDAVSCTLITLANMGQAVGDIGSMGSLNAQPAVAKIVYTVNMFLGRVEIFPILSVMYIIFNNRKHLW